MVTTSVITLFSFLGRISIEGAKSPYNHALRVRLELKEAKMSLWGFLTPETRHLPHVIHPNEHICGVVHGHNEEGSITLVATDRRVIYLDKKPLFTNIVEVSYNAVRGVESYCVAFYMTIILQTRVKNFIINTFNRSAAEQFVRFIEARCLERNGKEQDYDQFGKTRSL